MRIKIKSIKLKNFLSYKELSLDNLDKYKFIFLIGENGSGKSALIEAIVFNLFGKTYRGNLKDLCLKGETFFETEVEYVVGQGKILKINRSLNLNVLKNFKDEESFKSGGFSSYLKVYINNNEISLRKILTTQEKIIKQFIPYEFEFFSKSHFFRKGILNENEDSLPVTDLIEQLFGVDEIDKLFKEIGTQKLVFMNSFKKGLEKLNIVFEEINKLKELKNKEIDIIKENIETRKNLILEHKEKIKSLNEDKIKKNDEKTKIEKEIENLKSLLNEDQKKLKETENIFFHLENMIKNYTKLLNENKCIACERPFSEKDKENYKEKIKEKEKEKRDLEKIKEEINLRINNIKGKAKEFLENQKGINNLISEIEKEIHYYDETIKNLNKEVDYYEKTKNNTVLINPEEIKQKEKKLIEKFDILSRLSYFYEVFDRLEEELKEGSLFRYYFIRLDTLNELLSFYSDYFNLIFNIQLGINKKGKIFLYIKSKSKNQLFKFSNLSQGQSRRVVLILLFSVITYLLNNSKHLGILFFDEIFESLDTKGINTVLDYLSFLKKQDLQLFFITHSHTQLIYSSNLPDKIYQVSLDELSETSIVTEKTN